MMSLGAKHHQEKALPSMPYRVAIRARAALRGRTQKETAPAGSQGGDIFHLRWRLAPSS
jgi:hypothetical protein